MNRIKELRLQRNLNMRETANMLNIPYTTYVNYEKGLREPNSEMLITLADFFSVSVDYILGRSNDIVDERMLDIVNEIDNDILENSNGNLIIAKKLQQVRDMQSSLISVGAISHLEKYMQLDEISKATVDNVINFEYEQSIKRLNKQKEKAVYYLPEYDVPVSAGTGMPLDYSNCEITELTEKPPKGASFIVTVSGDSMEPTYTDGDRLYISKDTVIDYGTIGLFMYMGDVYVKEYSPEGLVSHNSKYGVINKNENIKCIGKVLGKVLN